MSWMILLERITSESEIITGRIFWEYLNWLTWVSPEVNIGRRWMISVNFILKQLFDILGIEYKFIPLTQSKITLKYYNQWWQRVYDLIKDDTQNLDRKWGRPSYSPEIKTYTEYYLSTYCPPSCFFLEGDISFSIETLCSIGWMGEELFGILLFKSCHQPGKVYNCSI